MPDTQLFTGIDIGSTAVRIVVGHRMPQGDKDNLHIIGAAEVPSEGITRGQINSIEDAVSSVSACVDKVERMIGSELGEAWVALNGGFVTIQDSQGVVAVNRPDGEIREEDIDRVIGQAQTMATPVNQEIVHVMTRSFTVDGQRNIKDPIGMTGVRLEASCQIVMGSSMHIKNLTKCVYRTGVTLDRLAVGTLAAAETLVTSRQKELGVAIVNIGAASTTMAVFEEGDVLHHASLPIGADHVTSDIAIGLRTSIDIAEKVKLQHASAVPETCSKHDMIDLGELGSQDEENVSRQYVCQIVEARLEELMEKIDKELKRVGRSGMLPAGVVFTGGGAKIPGLVELAKRKLRLPAVVGLPLDVTGITDRISDTSFATAIGLAQWWMSETAPEEDSSERFRPIESIRKVGISIRRILPF